MKIETIRPSVKVGFLGSPFLFYCVSGRTNLLRSRWPVYFGKGVSLIARRYECMHPGKSPKVSYYKAVGHCLKKGCQLLKVNIKKRRR